MKWYKIFKETDTHNGFRYVDGLNHDVNKFRKNGSCVSGGLYYSNAKNIHKFFHYGDYIREVEVPRGSMSVRDPQGSKLGYRWVGFGRVLKYIILGSHILLD